LAAAAAAPRSSSPKSTTSKCEAADLWIDPTENRRTFEQAGVADQVLPLRVEAHQLPFAHEFFDAVICVDA
jgi:hypothetical protein